MITNYSISVRDYIVNTINSAYNVGINFDSIDEIDIYNNRWDVKIKNNIYHIPPYSI